MAQPCQLLLWPKRAQDTAERKAARTLQMPEFRLGCSLYPMCGQDFTALALGRMMPEWSKASLFLGHTTLQGCPCCGTAQPSSSAGSSRNFKAKGSLTEKHQ